MALANRINWRSTAALRPLVRFARKLRNRSLHRPSVELPVHLLGSDYGAWPVIDQSLNRESRVYSFGIGEDISFDIELIKRFNCNIEAFDPTPRSLDWLATQELPSEFRVHPYGLYDREGIIRFAPPKDPRHVSFAVADHDEDSVALEVRPLDALMQICGDEHIDYLKMDIEGAEYPVIKDMVRKRIFPRQLCIEFHHGMYGLTDEDTLEAVSSLMCMGYKLHYVSDVGREYAMHLPDKLSGGT